MAYAVRKGPSTEMVECPYNKYHRVTVYKFWEHLQRCRRQYKLDQKKKGGPIDVFTCKHNAEHLILAPELAFHEARCLDGKKVREAGIGSPNKQKQVDVFKGIKVGVVTSQEEWGKEFLIAEIINPRLRESRLKKEAEVAAELEEKQKRRKEKEEMEKLTMTPKELEEYLFWNTFDDKTPGFDYFKNLQNPKVEWYKYPPNLTKAQRKQYEKTIKVKADFPKTDGYLEDVSSDPVPGCSKTLAK